MNCPPQLIINRCKSTVVDRGFRVGKSEILDLWMMRYPPQVIIIKCGDGEERSVSGPKEFLEVLG